MPTPNLNDLKFVVIDNPYDCLQDAEARDLWSKIMALKLAGYRSEYQYGVLPVDAADFYACHMAIFARNDRDELRPILVCKNISLERHKVFSRDEFMLVEHFQRSNALEHLQAIRDLVARSEREGKSLHYFGSYTNAPEVRVDKDFSMLLKELFTALYVNFHLAYGVDISTGAGAKKFKVDKMLETWGYEKLKLKGKILPDYNPACIFGNDATFFEAERFSDYAYAIAKKYQSLWDARLHYGSPIRKVARVA